LILTVIEYRKGIEVDWFLENLERKNPFSYARFNDGEMIAINQVGSVVARGDQVVDTGLSDALRESLAYRQHNYYVGIPCSQCYPELNRIARSIVGDYEHVTSAVATTNRNWKRFVEEFPRLMSDRRMLWVGGDDQSIEPLKDMGLNVVRFARVPRRNSWDYYRDLKSALPQYFQEGDFVGISLGPTARVLARHWFEEYPDITFVDMGSNFDPFTRNVRHNCHKGWDETGFNLTKPCMECN
jgi:hypothetical protein